MKKASACAAPTLSRPQVWRKMKLMLLYVFLSPRSARLVGRATKSNLQQTRFHSRLCVQDQLRAQNTGAAFLHDVDKAILALRYIGLQHVQASQDTRFKFTLQSVHEKPTPQNGNKAHCDCSVCWDAFLWTTGTFLGKCLKIQHF